MRARLCPWTELTPAEWRAWEALESRALDPNAYLSPHFVLPALRHLLETTPIMVLLIEQDTGRAPPLIGLGVFEAMRGSWKFPLPHLRALSLSHCYLHGLLLDREHAEAAVKTFLAWCARPDCQWHAVEFATWPSESRAGRLIRTLAPPAGSRWLEQDCWNRATLNPANAGDDYLSTQLSASRQKDLRRRQRRLQELGPVQWMATGGQEIHEDCVERFLALEQAGWKGEKGSALNCNEKDRRFFRDMVQRFAAAGRAVFTELQVGDVVVASTINFISGNGVFAFKLGWHPDFAKMAPGILNEVELVRNAPTLFAGMESMDSGASADSFMAELWNQRTTLCHATLITSTTGKAVTSLVRCARNVKRRLTP